MTFSHFDFENIGIPGEEHEELLMLELFLFAGFFAQFDFADQNQHL
jgi:hypothetical protein